LRIEKATELILNSPELNVTEIAMKTGFDDSAYFSRQFKKIIGTAPLAYIKNRRNKVNPNIPY
jgi:YesN/AraC family two-component response regulator